MDALIQIVAKQWWDLSNPFHLLLEKDILWNNIKQFASMEVKMMELLQFLMPKLKVEKDQLSKTQMQQGKRLV